jgi:hypothetical protein
MAKPVPPSLSSVNASLDPAGTRCS